MRTRCLAVAGAILGLGCSEDVTRTPVAPEPILTGHWELTDIGSTTREGGLDRISDFATLVRFGRSFVTIEEDRIRATNKRGVGFRHKHESPIVVTDAFVVIDGSEWSYVLSGDDLELANDEIRVELERRDSAPDFDTWVVEYTSLFTRNTTNQSTGDLAYSSGNLWVSGGPDGFDLTRIDLSTFVSSVTALDDLEPSAIVLAQGRFFANNGISPRVFLLDGDETLLSTISFGVRLTALASEGSLLWGVSQTDATVYAYDLVREEHVGESRLGFGLSLAGGTALNGRLYLIASGVVTVFHVVLGESIALQPETAFHLPGHTILGIAHDGTDFWVNARDDGSSNRAMRLHRVVPAGG